jgi:hypothetical protein
MDQYFASTLERISLPAPGCAFTLSPSPLDSSVGAVATAAATTAVVATGVAVAGVAGVASNLLSGGKYICMLGSKRFFFYIFFI